MKLVIVVGPGAVGKMTVAKEICQMSGLKLFHGHMTIEPVIELFGNFNSKVIGGIREIILSEFAKTDNKGIVLTYMWAFELESDWKNMQHYYDMYKNAGGEVYFVELFADQKTRLERHVTPDRLKEKASKRDLTVSTARLLNEDENHRLNSVDGEVKFENYLKIDNTNLTPQEVAKIVCDKFDLY